MSEETPSIFVNGRKKLLPRDRAHQTLLSFLRGAPREPTAPPSVQQRRALSSLPACLPPTRRSLEDDVFGALLSARPAAEKAD